MPVLAITTCSDKAEARKIANAVIRAKLAACVNIVPGVTSIYRWKGRKKEGSEVMLLMKTTEINLKKLGETVRKNHSYELEEFITIPIGGSREYIEWIQKETIQ